MNNSILIILPNITSKAPYIEGYLSTFNKMGITFDLIEWNRGGENISTKNNCFSSRTIKIPFFGKIVSYFLFFLFVRNIVRNTKYDSCLVFSLTPLFFLYSILSTQNKLCVDIRDYNNIYDLFIPRYFINKLLYKANLVVVSSDGFYHWLPTDLNVLLCHNISSDYFDKFSFSNQIDAIYRQIIITTIGTIRDFNENELLIKTLSEYSNIYLKFIGQSDVATRLRNKYESSTVFFHGLYHKSEELSLLKGSNFINILTSQDYLGRFLLSNRLYLSVLLGIPCIVWSNTTQAQYVLKYKLGIVINDYSEIKELLDDFVINFSADIYLSNRIKFFDKIRSDNNYFDEQIKLLFSDK